MTTASRSDHPLSLSLVAREPEEPFEPEQHHTAFEYVDRIGNVTPIWSRYRTPREFFPGLIPKAAPGSNIVPFPGPRPEPDRD